MKRLSSLVVAAALAALPALADPADERMRRLAAGAGQGQTLMRIGLAAGPRILVSSGRSFRIVDPQSGRDVWRESYRGEVAVLAEGGPRESVATIYRVQVGAFTDEASANRERDRLAGRFGGEAIVRHDPDRGVWRVRLGRAEQRLALQPLMQRLREAGFSGFWISEEPASRPEGVTLRLVDAEYRSHETSRTRLAVIAEAGGRVEVDGVAYRGLIELRVSPYGTVRPINWIDLESYLRGVVPRELGPAVWPRVEALKAQAVAARTYAWRHRDQFADEGFDLCATPRCQVYGGADAEHPLSDRAVSETGGLVLTQDDEPINAYYTATCGGHTENVENVFPEEGKVSYLRGVACRAEKDAVATQRGKLTGREPLALRDETGRDVSASWAILAAAGVVREADLGQAVIDGPLLRRWTRRLALLAGRPEPAGVARPTPTLAAALVALARDTGWQERARVLVDEEDIPALLRGTDEQALDPEARRTLAYMVWAGAIAPFPDGSYRTKEPPTPARLAPALRRIGEAYDAFALQSATVARVRERRLALVEGAGEIRVSVERRPWLLGSQGGRTVSVPALELWPGDRIRYRLDAKGKIGFLELLPPVKGTSDDRSAKVYSWEVRKTRRELERTINRRVGIGELRDLRIVRRGVSGRVAELEIRGSRATTSVQGFDVRRLLDLRESLTVLELQRDGAGRLEAVVFAGKGWGHGVGLCQVGAYGMAVRGEAYDAILGHYYRGAKLQRVTGNKR